MGTALVGAVALIKYLVSRGGCDVSILSAAVGVTADALSGLVDEINAVQPLIKRDGDRLTLLHPVDLLDAQEIFKKTHGAGRVEVFDKIDSTNTCLLNRAENLVSGDALLSEIQTAGRGRREDRWLSEICSNIILSMSWKFPSASALEGLPCAIGVVAADALRELGFGDVMVKWPNDLYIGERKLGGILVEAVPLREGGVMTVIGMGLNVYRPHQESLGEGRMRAYLKSEVQPGLRNALSAALIDAFKRCCTRYAEAGLEPFLPALAALDYLKGRRIAVSDVKSRCSGVASGFAPSGELILKEGERTTLVTAGHVELL